ncbi:MAG: TraB/GumN family protein, partial [Prevotellaceae bacterium]|nr:TraB/GumN family protein [Prevotellaceae bacterium]
MKFYFLGILLAVASTLCQAQMLWRISGEGLEKPSYLFGTYQVGSMRVLDSIKVFWPTFHTTDRVVGELNHVDTPPDSLLAEWQAHIYMDKDTTWQQLMSAGEFSLVNAQVKTYMGIDLAELPRPLKPAYVSNNLQSLIINKSHPDFFPDLQMDLFFQRQAVARGKSVLGLETVAYQMELLFVESLQRQADELVCLVTHIDDCLADDKRYAESYYQQDLEALWQQYEQRKHRYAGTKCDTTDMRQAALLEERTARWMTLLPALLSEASNFIAVDALHLPGPRGL